MTAVASVINGIRGAMMLARGRAEGVALVDTDRIAALRSFWAVPLCLPSILLPRVIIWTTYGQSINLPLALGRYVLAFVVGWMFFVWVSHPMARAIGRAAEWPRFIAVWSYCSIIENTLAGLGVLPDALGAPPMLAEACELITLGWVFWLEWYAIRLSLRVGSLTAAVFLLVDSAIGAAMAMLGLPPG